MVWTRDLAIPVRRVQTPLKSWIFQASLRNCKTCVHNCEDHSFNWSHIRSSYDSFHEAESISKVQHRDWRWVIFEYLQPFLLLWKSKITVSDRRSYCLGHKSIFQAQVINSRDNLIRNRSNWHSGHKLLDETSENKSKVSVSTVSNHLRSFSQQLFTDNNNQRSEYNKRVLFLFYGISRYSGKNHMDKKDDVAMTPHYS